jgi:hypothetical protein
LFALLPLPFVLQSSCWLLLCPLGWAAAWQLGLARHNWRLQQYNNSKLRTPLLSLHVRTLKPNPRAGLPKQKNLLQPPLRLVKPD